MGFDNMGKPEFPEKKSLQVEKKKNPCVESELVPSYLIGVFVKKSKHYLYLFTSGLLLYIITKLHT